MQSTPMHFDQNTGKLLSYNNKCDLSEFLTDTHTLNRMANRCVCSVHKRTAKAFNWNYLLPHLIIDINCVLLLISDAQC